MVSCRIFNSAKILKLCLENTFHNFHPIENGEIGIEMKMGERVKLCENRM